MNVCAKRLIPGCAPDAVEGMEGGGGCGRYAKLQKVVGCDRKLYKVVGRSGKLQDALGIYSKLEIAMKLQETAEN